MSRLAFTLAVLMSSTASAKEIPLKKIRAVDMPGTQEMHGGVATDPRSTPENILVSDIKQSLPFLPRDKEPRLGFVVVGTGMKALQAAHAILVAKGPPRQTVPVDKELTAVFFSYEVGSYVHLTKVTRDGNTITIQYCFVPHLTKEMTRHFALIPIGRFKQGKVNVNMQQVDEKGQIVDKEWNRPISKSFSFEVHGAK